MLLKHREGQIAVAAAITRYNKLYFQDTTYDLLVSDLSRIVHPSVTYLLHLHYVLDIYHGTQ